MFTFKNCRVLHRQKFVKDVNKFLTSLKLLELGLGMSVLKDFCTSICGK